MAKKTVDYDSPQIYVSNSDFAVRTKESSDKEKYDSMKSDFTDAYERDGKHISRNLFPHKDAATIKVDVKTNIQKIACQAESIHKNKGKRWDTLFYKAVLGGNEEVVADVIACLEKDHPREVIDWLLCLNAKEKWFHAPVKSLPVLRLTQIVMFLLLSMITTILSPIFFALHGFSVSIFMSQKRTISANIKLPLAYAAFSQNDKMFQLFLDNGVDIEHEDGQGNNVFHYIADLSSESPERAIEIFKATVKFIDNFEVVRQLLVKRRNASSLTAIEYTSKFGSLALLTQMLNQPNLLQHTAFAIGKGKDAVCIADKELDVPLNTDFETRLEYVDVSMYESGRLAKQSVILNLLSDREITELSREDMELFDRISFVGRWMTLKIKQTIGGVGLFHLFDAALTVFVLYIIIYGASIVPFSISYTSEQTSALMKEITAACDLNSTVLTKQAYQRVLLDVKFDFQQEFFVKKDYPRHKLEKLYEQTFNNNFLWGNWSITDEYDSADDINITSNETSIQTMNELFYHALLSKEFSDDETYLAYLYNLDLILPAYSCKVAKTRGDLFFENVSSSNREYIEKQLREFHDHYTITFGPERKNPTASLKISHTHSFDEFTQLFCMPSKYFTDRDLENLTGVLPPENLYTSSCELKALYGIANKDCETKDGQIYNTVKEYIGYMKENEILYPSLTTALIILSSLYLVLDLIERYVYIYTCVSSHTHVYDMIMSNLSKKVPGSYTRKQLTILACFAFLIYGICSHFIQEISFEWRVTMDSVNQSISYFLVAGMIFRFVMHIHGLRLLPGIGNFVIATFMMSTNLIHFSTIYAIVMFIFSVIFYVIIDDPNCPLRNYKGFTNIGDSMFQTFKLTFGHDEFTAYYTTPSAKITYAIFVIISALLLLNLIIAIMSTTATDIMTDPWKDTLWRIEWLDEALSVEYTTSVLTLPFAKCLDFGYWSHKRAGYDVQCEKGENGTRYKVFIEVFQCPALK